MQAVTDGKGIAAEGAHLHGAAPGHLDKIHLTVAKAERYREKPGGYTRFSESRCFFASVFYFIRKER